jgi:hypothetical protein
VELVLAAGLDQVLVAADAGRLHGLRGQLFQLVRHLFNSVKMFTNLAKINQRKKKNSAFSVRKKLEFLANHDMLSMYRLSSRKIK